MGRGTTFEGNACIEGNLLIEGILHGHVVCSDTLMLAQDGNADANLRARDIVIAGTVTGEMDAESRIKLESTARLQGKLRAIALIVEEGAVLKADCDIGGGTISLPLPAQEPLVAASSHGA